MILMKKFLKFNYYLALTAGLVMGLSSCKPDEDIDPPPVDSAPIISISNPSVPYTLARTGDIVNITFQAHDNELLNLFRITELRKDPSGVTYQAETEIFQAAVSDIDHEHFLNYEVPAVPQWYSTIELRGYAVDNKGRTVSVKFAISVIPPAGSGSSFAVQSYDNDTINPGGDTIWMGYTGLNGGGYNYDIFNHRVGYDSDISLLDRHLTEVSASIVDPVSSFISPYWQGQDSVLVVTDYSILDFDNLTWETTWQAFMSSNQIGGMAGPPVQPGNIVILKLNTPTIHFAVFKIEGVQTDATVAMNNYVRFNYKYTYTP